MRRDLLKVLLDVCDRHVAASLPAFQLCTSQPFVGSGRLYADSSSKPVFFLFFQISDKRDAFTVELAWSESGAFPSPSDYPVPRDWPEIGVQRGDVEVGEFRFRITKLLAKPVYDPWWEFLPRLAVSKSVQMSVVADQHLDDLAKCEQLVADAVGKILDAGCAYMREIRARPRWNFEAQQTTDHLS